MELVSGQGFALLHTALEAFPSLPPFVEKSFSPELVRVPEFQDPFLKRIVTTLVTEALTSKTSFWERRQDQGQLGRRRLGLANALAQACPPRWFPRRWLLPPLLLLRHCRCYCSAARMRVLSKYVRCRRAPRGVGWRTNDDRTLLC